MIYPIETKLNCLMAVTSDPYILIDLAAKWGGLWYCRRLQNPSNCVTKGYKCWRSLFRGRMWRDDSASLTDIVLPTLILGWLYRNLLSLPRALLFITHTLPCSPNICHSLTHSLLSSHSLIHSFPLTHSSTLHHSPILCHSLTHSLTNSSPLHHSLNLCHSLTHSLLSSHSLIQSPSPS